MELWIIINESANQLTCISRDQLCYFQDGIQYKFPYLVRYGQLERFISSICKECPNGFIRFKTLHGTEYVVLHQGQRKTGNLCREMNRLTFSEIQERLAIAISTFCDPAHGVNPVGFKETEFHVSSEQSVPMTITSMFAEEQADCRSSILKISIFAEQATTYDYKGTVYELKCKHNNDGSFLYCMKRK